MGEFVRNKKTDGTVEVLKTTDAMLEEIGRMAHGWENERDYIRTLCEVHMRWANDDTQRVFRSIINITKGAH